jgi:hypothetical protein
VLDNTVILWTSEVDGGDAHTVQSIPVILIGNLGGALKPGQFVSYGPPGGIDTPTLNTLSANGRNMGDLFSTLSTAMGVPITSFGPRMGQGLLKEILT